MVQLVWSERAIKDLNSIGEYIAIDSEQAAKKFIQQLIEKVNILSLHPGKGRPIPERIPGNYRQILYKSYRIIYRQEKETVIISSVYHQKKILLKI
ncbi:MAG: type II toxin-antitoxin system RelE/ParE family toxin [Bacteroidota bacterium]|nr:type II toxin-antitoxin system RelE/ParE family toxin [Bacteroidota bacterium]